MPPNAKPAGPPDWENPYQQGDTPWITRQPSQELQCVLDEEICREFAPPTRIIHESDPRHRKPLGFGECGTHSQEALCRRTDW
jgi:hypothetical protein